MASFTHTTVRALTVGALVLGAGVYYEGFASRRLEEANRALRSVDSARSQLATATARAEIYLNLLTDMADSKIDRQEPFSVVSEFSPREIQQLGPLLGTLYRRDGHFFLQRFQLAWRQGNPQRGLLPRVALDLEGQKVLLFSEGGAQTSPLALAKQ